MATTFVDYTGDGNATKPFSFPSIKEADIKVDVDGVTKSSGTHYNITSYTITGGGNVVFTSGNIPASPASIRIFRDTDVDSAKATFTAGSSVKAGDLNNNMTQILYAAQEEQNQTIQTHKIKSEAVTTAKIADNSVNSSKLAPNAVTTGELADTAVNTPKLDNLAVTTAKIANDAVTTDKLANSINTEIAANTAKTTNQTHTGDVTGSVALTIASGAVTTAKIAADAINGTKIADDSINSEHYVDGSIDTVHVGDLQITENKIADSAVTTGKVANNAVTTAKIADAELKTLAGMQSGTASVLADSTALTASTAELNQLDGITLETSVTTSSDTRIPTSKAVNDLVLSVTNALGGFVAIANETSFPTANPDPSNGAGTVVSISQLASGLAVNGSGVATISNGAGTGNTVTITGFPSSLQSQTLPATSGLNVQTTTTLHTYTFHKQLASAADIQAISATVNSFSNRYRVSASAPTSSLDGGDLWYDTTNSKLMVYSSADSAWEETTAIGNFFISTLSSSSSTGGGSATPNGTAYRFTLSVAPTSAQQLIVSVDGVIQKPNAGSSQPSEGYAIDGNDIIFGSAPVNGASIFVTVLGSAVGIGTPSNNTVTSAILQNGSVIEAKLGTGAVTSGKIGTGAVTTAKVADEAITLAKLPHGTSSNDGKFLRANNGADPTFETVDFTNLNASNLTSGTIPDSRFPSTLPAVNGANLTGIAAFPSGTKMLFQQTAAPTGWTKVTSGINNKTLRVVSGTAGSGGTNAFTDTFTGSVGITANAGNTTTTGNISVANAPSAGNITVDSATTGGTVDSHTLTINEIPAHTHNYTKMPDDNRGWSNNMMNNYRHGNTNTNAGTGSTGGGQGHSHGFTGGSHSHTASFTGAAHNHNATFTGTAHNHSISVSNLDLAVQYLDVIIASKD